MAGLAHCSLLEELYLSHNGIQCLQVSADTLALETSTHTLGKLGRLVPVCLF